MKKLEAGAEAGLAADTMPTSAVADEKAEHTNNGTSSPSEDAEGDPPKAPLTKVESQSEKMSRGRIVVIMLALCIALFLAALDMTIITTALPTIAGHFHANEGGYTWIGSAYLLANAASVPLWGKLSDIWGRKPIILTANIVFLIGSLICALSIDIGMLIVGRAVQGTGGGGLIIMVNICISDMFSMRERATYFGIVGMVWALASAIGPVLGGVFTEKVSWRWCFYINLPLDGCAFVILIFFLSIETPKTPLLAGLRAIDWLGSLTIVGGTVMFLLGLEFGGVSHPWASATTLCLIIFGVVVIAAFFVNEWKLAKYPVMPISLFKKRSNIASLLVSFCHGFVFISGTYFLPLYFQTVIGATPLLSGVYLFPFALSLSFMSAFVGIFIKKTGRYLEPIRFGMVLMTLGFGLYIDLKPYPSWSRIIIFQIIAGIGVGPNFQAPLIALQSTVHPQDIATATATFGFIRQLSTSISVVLGGVIFQNGMKNKQDMLRAALGPAVASHLAASSSGSSTAFLRTLPPAQKTIVDLAYTDSLQKMWIFYTCIGVFGIVCSFFIGKRELSKTHEKSKQGLEEQERHRKERKQEERDEKMEKDRRKNGQGTKEIKQEV